MDHPRGLERHLEDRVGRAEGERLGEVAWVSHRPESYRLRAGTGRPADSHAASPTTGAESNPMNETATTPLDTDQATREASGAHEYGRYLEEFEVGAVYKHWPAKTVTEADDHLFCLITMNHHPLHINDVYAAESQQGQNVVVGPLVYSLALGMTVSDVSGKAIANLATEDLKHPAPVFHGDTLFCETEVLEVTESRSKPDRGVVKVHTRVYKQDGTLVAEFKRTGLGAPQAGEAQSGATDPREVGQIEGRAPAGAEDAAGGRDSSASEVIASRPRAADSSTSVASSAERA